MQHSSRGADSWLTVRTIGPLVGLLAMTMGIVNAATGMSKGVRLEAVFAGVMEALITTVVGLVVIVPAVWLYNRFRATR
jgi:biopolymer transport protein ExbB/TolQ